jgi:hypothetical protein
MAAKAMAEAMDPTMHRVPKTFRAGCFRLKARRITPSSINSAAESTKAGRAFSM